MSFYKYLKYILLLVGISLTSVYLYFQNIGNSYLTFSDGAKFADIARNLNLGLGYGEKFSFWSGSLSELINKPIFPATWIPPLMPLSIAMMFRFLGANDLVVMATSTIYFVLLVIAVFLLGQKTFGRLAGVLASLAVSTNINFIEYAKSGASEPLFALEIVLSAYFITLKKRLTTVLAFIVMILMYFTRPQAFIYITGLCLYWLLVTFNYKKVIIYFLLIIVTGILIDRVILNRFAGNYFLYPILERGKQILTHVTASSSSSDALRNTSVGTSSSPVIKKILYNLYNYYKLLPQIASPYMWTLFIIGLFKYGRNKVENSFKISSLFMIMLTFVVASLTIPFFRYIHPIIPLVLLIAVDAIIWIMSKTSDLLEQRVKWITKRQIVVVMSSFLIFFFVMGQTLGVIFLDSRFNEKKVNKDKPPVYVILSRLLKENTKQDDVVVTNLDTWGSWYGERKTIWYPLTPEMLEPPERETNSFDAIYLTSYLMNDADYYMGDEWREIFENPDNIQDKFIRDNYKIKGVYETKADDTYEREAARAILLVRSE